MSTTTSPRARSRLSRKPTSPAASPANTHSSLKPATSQKSSRQRSTVRSQLEFISSRIPSISSADWLASHIAQLVTLGASLLLIALLLTTVSPSKVANVGFTQSYLPLLLLIAAAVYSLSRLVVRHRHALMISIPTVILIFFHLHSVRASWSYLLLPIALIAAIEVVILLAKKR